MDDVYATVRKVALPRPVIEKTRVYLASRGIDPGKARHITGLCMEKLDAFETLAAHVSLPGDYGNLLSTVFSSDTVPVTFFFNPANWERIRAVQTRHNIGAGDIVRLILASYLFPSGRIALPLIELAQRFIAGKQDYLYNCLLTRLVNGILTGASGERGVNRETMIRAASYFYEKRIGSLPAPVPEDRYRVTSSTTGWSRITVSGSLFMRDYYHREKEKSGIPRGILIPHTVYSFLTGLGADGRP
jgi:hypothetical protein